MTAEEAIKWLEQHQGVTLISDDDSRWAVSDMGDGPCPNPDGPHLEITTYCSDVDPNYWFGSIVEAVEYAADKWEGADA